MKGRALVIGAGLGGLSSAALLAQRGHLDVDVVERLGFLGGRFTQLDHDGFAIPTGTVHMIPHGRKGPMGNLLLGKRANGGLELGERGVDIIPSGSLLSTQKGDLHEITTGIKSLLKYFGWRDRLGLFRIMANRSCQKPREGEPTTRNWLEKRFTPRGMKIAEAFSRFTLSLPLSQLPESSGVLGLKRGGRLGRPGVPKGGCKGIIDGLADYLNELGASLTLKQEVFSIENGGGTNTSRKYRVGIKDRHSGKKKWMEYDSIIANCGANILAGLLSEGLLAKSSLDMSSNYEGKAATGIGFAYALEGSIPQNHGGVTLTPDAKWMGGYVIPSFDEPSLAPNGKHLFISHHLLPEGDIVEAIDEAKEELFQQVQWLDSHSKLLTTHTFHSRWPVNRASQGFDLSPDIGLEGIRMIGDEVKKHGWMMTEGIAAQVPEVVFSIEKESMK